MALNVSKACAFLILLSFLVSSSASAGTGLKRTHSILQNRGNGIAFLESKEGAMGRSKKGGLDKIADDAVADGKAQLKDAAINAAVGVAKNNLPDYLQPKKPKREPMPVMPKDPVRPKSPPWIRSAHTPIGMKEACVGCFYVWTSANSHLDESAGYEAVKDAFERACASVTSVFFDVCDSMFENEETMINDDLQNAPIIKMCYNAGVCQEGLGEGLPI